MADGGVTSSGLLEFKAGVEKLPAAVTAAARNVARRTALAVAAGARLRVRVRSGAMQRSIRVDPDEQHRQYKVTAGNIDGPPIALFLELGTVHMSAKPFMGPALEAERGNYERDLERETAAAARQVLG